MVAPFCERRVAAWGRDEDDDMEEGRQMGSRGIYLVSEKKLELSDLAI